MARLQHHLLTPLRHWWLEALIQYLSTGDADGDGSASAPMAEVIDNSLRHLRPATSRRTLPSACAPPGRKLRSRRRITAHGCTLIRIATESHCYYDLRFVFSAGAAEQHRVEICKRPTLRIGGGRH